MLSLIRTTMLAVIHMKGVNLYNFDVLVKSLQDRHPRESGSPEVIDFPGFPLSREWHKQVSDFLRIFHIWMDICGVQ